MIRIETFADRPDSELSAESLDRACEEVERLEAQIALLNRQIEAFSKLAVESCDLDTQERYWRAARDISREALELSRLLRKQGKQSSRSDD